MCVKVGHSSNAMLDFNCELRTESSSKINAEITYKTQISENISNKNVEETETCDRLGDRQSEKEKFENEECIILKEVQISNIKDRSLEVQNPDSSTQETKIDSERNSSLKTDSLSNTEDCSKDSIIKNTEGHLGIHVLIEDVFSINRSDHDSDIELLECEGNDKLQCHPQVKEKTKPVLTDDSSTNQSENPISPSTNEAKEIFDTEDCIILNEVNSQVASVNKSALCVEKSKSIIPTNNGDVNILSGEPQNNILEENISYKIKMSKDHSVSTSVTISKEPKVTDQPKVRDQSNTQNSLEDDQILSKNIHSSIVPDDCIIIDDDSPVPINSECEHDCNIQNTGNNSAEKDNTKSISLLNKTAESSSLNVNVKYNPAIIELLSIIDFEDLKKIVKDAEVNRNILAISNKLALDNQTLEEDKVVKDIKLPTECQTVSNNNLTSSKMTNDCSVSIVKETINSEKIKQASTLPEVIDISDESLLAASDLLSNQKDQEPELSKNDLQNMVVYQENIPYTKLEEISKEDNADKNEVEVLKVLPVEKSPCIKSIDNLNTHDLQKSGPIKCEAGLSSSNRIEAVSKSKEQKQNLIKLTDVKIPDDLNLKDKPDQKLPIRQTTKKEIIENPEDELDILATSSIQKLNESKNIDVFPLMNLYKKEYNKYLEIKYTEKNVSAGLKLLEDTQAKKLMHIRSSLKNILKHDPCFHKTVKETEYQKQYLTHEKKGSFQEKKQPSTSFNTVKNESIQNISKMDTFNGDYNKIIHPSVFENAQKYVKSSTSSGSSSGDKEVYELLINSKCAQCGKKAIAACQGCAKVYYCSAECGMISWDNGHSATCGT